MMMMRSLKMKIQATAKEMLPWIKDVIFCMLGGKEEKDEKAAVIYKDNGVLRGLKLSNHPLL